MARLELNPGFFHASLPLPLSSVWEEREQATQRLGEGLGSSLPTPSTTPPAHIPGWGRGGHPALRMPHLAGFGRENTWIGLNDRIVERDFQWTDNTGLVSGRSQSLGLPRTVGWVGATWALCSGLTLPSCADPPEVLIALRFSSWLAKELQQSPR